MKVWVVGGKSSTVETKWGGPVAKQEPPLVISALETLEDDRRNFGQVLLLLEKRRRDAVGD
ncbi:MAG: hypothetical protein P9E24_09795, partial [Candidatus Competibacter sp.]|nr:hypothetical protein [Candidatus Competibacter sp.]MDG4585257.1 hypothetical protein [Candidatus Competibacter sp.]